MKNNKRRKLKSSKIFKITFIFSFVSSIICEVVAVIFLCKQVINILDFGLITAVLIILCMTTLGQCTTFEEMEELENKINVKISRISKKINKD